MWKILVGFVIFAALALYILTKSGGNVDLLGTNVGLAGTAVVDASGTSGGGTLRVNIANIVNNVVIIS